MFKFKCVVAAAGFLAVSGALTAADANCSAPPLYFSGSSSETEWPLTVQAGTGCSFGVSGIEGAITEVQIVQKPKFGRAGVQGLKAYYVAKPGYQGPDEFAYAFIGTDQYGGPTRAVFKRKVTVVP